jgi:hypothetical protein
MSLYESDEFILQGKTAIFLPSIRPISLPPCKRSSVKAHAVTAQRLGLDRAARHGRLVMA